VGLYWTPEFIAAWRAFQAKLAARYDSEPLIRHVAVTSCAPQTDEPFVTTTDSTSQDTMVNTFSYSDQAEKDCLTGAVDDYAAWKRTLIDFTFNPFVKISGGKDIPFTQSVMELCRSKLGSRCVLDNHALNTPLADPTLDNNYEVYNEMQTLGGPINFQTASPRTFGCQWVATLARGVSFGGAAIEVWPNYQGFTTLSSDNVSELADLFVHPITVPAPADHVAACTGFL